MVISPGPGEGNRIQRKISRMHESNFGELVARSTKSQRVTRPLLPIAKSILRRTAFLGASSSSKQRSAAPMCRATTARRRWP